MAEQNGILKYDVVTGLKVGTKAEIQHDLQDIWKTAYGNDVVIDQGTETYSFIDLLSSLLADMGNAAKEMYDSLSFATAGTYRDDTTLQGAPLEMLCSLVGISRKDGESDTELRHRYYAYLYQQSVGTSEGLRAQMLKIQLSDYNYNKFTVKDAYIYNNGTGDEKTISYPAASETDPKIQVNTDVKIPPHSILPIIRIEGLDTDGNIMYNVTNSMLYSKDDNTSNYNAIKDCIENYKSLGCGLYEQTPYDESTQTQWYATNHDMTYAIIAMEILTRIQINVKIAYKDYVTFDTQQLTAVENAITQAIQTALTGYLSNFMLGQDLAYGDIVGRCYAEIDKLNYTAITCSISSVDYDTQCVWPLGEENTNIVRKGTWTTDGVFNVPYLCFITPNYKDDEGKDKQPVIVTFTGPA